MSVGRQFLSPYSPHFSGLRMAIKEIIRDIHRVPEWSSSDEWLHVQKWLFSILSFFYGGGGILQKNESIKRVKRKEKSGEELLLFFPLSPPGRRFA